MTPFTVFFAVAVLLFAIELLVLQFSVFWVALIGLGALIAALTVYLMPNLDWVGTTAVFVVASTAICLGMLKPMRKWQNSRGPSAGNDAIGQRVRVLKSVAAGAAGKVHWSGADWRAELAEGQQESLEAGEAAEIAGVSGITLFVKAI